MAVCKLVSPQQRSRQSGGALPGSSSASAVDLWLQAHRQLSLDESPAQAASRSAASGHSLLSRGSNDSRSCRSPWTVLAQGTVIRARSSETNQDKSAMAAAIKCSAQQQRDRASDTQDTLRRTARSPARLRGGSAAAVQCHTGSDSGTRTLRSPLRLTRSHEVLIAKINKSANRNGCSGNSIRVQSAVKHYCSLLFIAMMR